MIAVDPGVHFCAVAWFDDARELYRVEHRPAAWPLIATEEHVWIEVPQIYAGPRNQDLLDLAFAAGRMTANFKPDQVTRVRPAEWKRQIKKEAHHPRILEKLSDAERAVLDECGVARSRMHNILDAVGIGLYALGR